MTILAIDNEFFSADEVAAYHTKKRNKEENAARDRLQNKQDIVIIKD